jgi:hypothetical protein
VNSKAGGRFSLPDRKKYEIDGNCPTQPQGDSAAPDTDGFNDIHFKPVEPISVRATLTARF